jgi:maltose alpha-D-glucosyltransferase/alpha-amylase
MINDLWYKNGVIYCLSVASYMDANGDGVGDFQGLMRRLDYLHGLGITAIWLMPFQTSPGCDDGYDVSDYYNVDPRYGTLGDFVEFAHGAKQRGIRVIIDLVVNHTSNQHPWFKDARRDPSSTYRDWYVWSKKKPCNANKGMVLPGVQKSTWSCDLLARAWYFHRFYDFGEIYLPVERLVAYYGRDLEGVNLPFNFALLQAHWDAGTIAALIDSYEAARPAGG